MMRVFDHRSGSRLAALALALGCACVAPTLHAQGQPTTGPDVTVIDIYDIDSYDGLIKTYKKPFTAENHDAIGASDYIFTHFVAGEIVPLTQ